MKRIRLFQQRTALIGMALVIGLSLAMSIAKPASAFSTGLLQSRAVTLTSSAASAATTYNVSFKWATTGSVQGIVVDFCDDSPIPGYATCTLPTGFSISASPAVSGQTSTAGGNISTFTTVSQLNSNRTLVLRAGSAVAMTAGVTSSFNITTVTNPSTANHTFYARIYTYATSAGATGYTVASPNAGAAAIDSGGVAISTANQIAVNFDVAESLTFCVYTGVNCAAGGTSILLGDTNDVLSTAGSFVDIKTKYDIATNAAGASPAATVRFKAPLPTAGSATIATIGTTATTPAGSNTSLFGLCTYRTSGTLLTAVAPYDDSNCNTATQTAGTASTGGTGSAKFAFDTTNAATTYGSSLATMNAGASNSGQINFVGQVASTQKAGTYVAAFTFIATGTY
jgi:hypothetical protein